MKNSLVKELIEKEENKLSLLKELNESLIAESCAYVLKYEYNMGCTPIYSLLIRATNEVKIDRLSALNVILRRRNARVSDVFMVTNGKQ
jgi:hypothetical protein